ncbi:L,D-transpeptidase family protein [Parafrankia sp. BMG5.11]|uniref:L,D-transpeptidase family protein n=1 Tax=Parafrankia sp. BMG5.11 TaxID=222540 RepID=UPI001404E64E|nr:L,D-transpeptidase family protein [Parafrankia sp. BMG5.11]
MKISLLLGAAALMAASPLSANPRGDEPIAIPASIKQGIDFIYVDPQMAEVAKPKQKPRNWLQRIFKGREETRGKEPNSVFLGLAGGLERYKTSWGGLPQIKVAAGGPLKAGSKGRRVEQLRTRLGLPEGGGYDETLLRAVTEYQRVHGLDADGVAGRSTIASLNLGADHYARRIAINMERAYRLPVTRTFDRYVVVDSGAAEAYLVQGDKVVASMRVIVGAPKTNTPMLAVLMQRAKANPYWNVPPDMIQTVTAKRVLNQGVSYLKNFHYEVLSDWTPAAQVVDPKTVNWKQVAAGKSNIRVRQLPGPWNSMGEMKFEMPNDYGIYLHDTPTKEVFDSKDRWLSNGCVRLEDYRRFASWVYGGVPQPGPAAEQVLELPKPVPVLMTYLTVMLSGTSVQFRPDPYGFDALAMPQMFAATRSAGLEPMEKGAQS